MTDVSEVMFVCVHNAGRSQAAMALLDHHAQGRVHVRSAGSAPGEKVNDSVVAVLAERGIDIAGDNHGQGNPPRRGAFRTLRSMIYCCS